MKRLPVQLFQIRNINFRICNLELYHFNEGSYFLMAVLQLCFMKIRLLA